MPKTYTTPEIRVDCPDDRKFPIIDAVRDIFKKKYDVIDIDGARILMPGGWGLVRGLQTRSPCWCCGSRPTRRSALMLSGARWKTR